MKKIFYVDMDNVLVDFQSGIDQLSEEIKQEYEGHLDDVPGIFSLMKPMPRAVESVTALGKYFDLYVLSTAPWKNPSAWMDKARWIQKHFGEDEDSIFYKRIIITYHKNLVKGDFLIDDRYKHGVKEFAGEWIEFGSERFPDWVAVTGYLLDVVKKDKRYKVSDNISIVT